MLISFLGTISTIKKVLVVGTITAICTDKLWYYNGCNHCKSGVEERFVTKENPDGLSDVYHEKSLVCTNDKCEGVDIYSIPRFKIPIRVQDSSGTVSLTLFDFEAYKILQKTAKELVSIQDQVVNSGEIPNPYPEIFDTLIGKKYAFIISVKDYNIEHQVENYGISMATNDDEILSTLRAKFNLNQHEQSESLDVPDSCSLSTPVDLMKDEMSYCGDNVTPASQALIGTENPSSDETKCNIREVFDVDDALGCSSTKRRISDELSQDEDAGVSTLLIPKIEK
ncbi:putative nucleic acid-binding, replication factor A [Helianthus annuus]|nr:putative nucleic acid-binding, replication factor A [Helianthus annuus]